MKKSIAILAVFAFVAVAASAQITIGGWGRALFMPIVNSGADGAENVTDTAPSWGGWGGDKGRIGFTIAGNSDNVGFQIDANADGGTNGDAISLGDQQKIWVKPSDMVKLQIGRIYDDTLRGNAAFGSFNWYRAYGAGDGEDITFTRIGYEGSQEGVEVSVTPNDALYAALYFGDLDKHQTADLANNMQLAVGYTIAGLGQIKAQYYTNVSAYDVDGASVDKQATIEAAFKFTKVENLMVEAGLKMNTNDDITTTISYAGVDLATDAYKKIALYANYKMDAMTFHFLTIAEMANIILLDESETLYKIGLGLDYAMADGIGVSADLRYTNTTIEDSEATTNFFVGATKGFSNGLIGAGLEVKSFDGTTGYAVPVRFEYWF